MCDFDDMDPLDFAFIAGFVETMLEGDEPLTQEEEPTDDLLDCHDPTDDEEDDY